MTMYSSNEKRPRYPSTKNRGESLPSMPRTLAEDEPHRWRAWVAGFVTLLLLLTAFYRVTQCCHSVGQLPAAFLQDCQDLLQSPSQTYTERVSRLADSLEPNTIWIAEPGTSSEYFLGGFSSRAWWLSERPLLIAISPSQKNVTILTAKFEQARAELVSLPREIRDITTFVPWLESESPYDIMAQHFGEHSARKIVLDEQVRSFIAEGLHGAGCDKGSRDEGEKVKELRERKDEREIGLLRCANQMTLHAIKRTRSKMHFGITESKTRTILVEEMLKTGLVDGDGLVLFGENAATPHGEGSARKLGKRDMILIDAGGKWGGYTADVTRTFSIKGSKIPSRHLDVWETVRKVQYAAYEALVKSAHPHFAQLDVAARDLITAFVHPLSDHDSMATPDYSVFTTRLGHGIGLDGHESPFVNQGPQGEREIKAGHVFSIEPGIYIPSDMKVQDLSGVGVRLEDCFVVTEKDGKLDGEWLTGPVTGWGDI